MSTKTTLKRIALVAVSALGFGLLSAGPSAAVAGTFTTAASLSTSSMTIVADSTGAGEGGKFYVDLTSNGTLADKYPGLFATESISVTVTAPTGGTVGDIGLQAVALSTNDNTTAAAGSASGGFATIGAQTTGTGTLSGSAFQIPNGAALSSYDSQNWTPDANSETAYSNRYWIHVLPINATPATLGLAYTLTVRVHTADAASSVIVNTLSVKFVTSMADSGAALTLTSVGDVYKGEGLSVVSGRYVRATVTNGTTGGRLFIGCAAATAITTACTPSLTAQWVPISGTPSTSDTFYIRDNGVPGEDHLAVTNSSRTNNVTSVANREYGNGSYGITTISSSGGSATDIAQAAAADTVLRVSITGAATTSRATAAIIIRDETTARDNKTDLSMSVTGSVAYNTTSGISTATAGDVARTDVESSTTWVLPLTTTSGTLTINVDDVDNAAVSGAVIKVTPTWSNSYVSTAVSPATSTTGTSYTTDASGNVSVAFSNSTPVDGGTLTLSVTGFASGAGTVGTGSRTVVIVWQKPVVTSVTVLDPNSDVYVKTRSTNTFTVEVDDQFGNAMAGEVLQPSISDTSAANYVLNKTYATITTGASGTATWSLTDAAAADEDYDTIVFTSITNTAKTGRATITYVATLPVVSTVNLYFDADKGDTANTLAGTSSIGTFSLQKARNQSRSLASFVAATGETATDDFISMRARVLTAASVAAEGAACTVTASAGAHLLSAANLPVSSRTLAVNGSGDVTWTTLATTVGVKTYTVVCGSVEKTITMVITNNAIDARFITITGGTTGTANGEGVPVTVKVTDRFGNGVGSVLLTLSASGAGVFSGGATTQSFTTDATGTYTFLATSLATAGGAGTFSATAASTAEFAAAAGKAANTAGTAYVTIDSDVAAGKNSASHTVTFAAGQSAAAAAAEAATDAAAEAIDAANAATDAANLAAEAADAATVAAEEARDAADAATAAVEELATQVATLMAALKAQITTLANTVAKIAKKVKA